MPQDQKEAYDTLRLILAGQKSVKLYLEFLKRNNKVDMLVLKHTKVHEPTLQLKRRLITYCDILGLT